MEEASNFNPQALVALLVLAYLTWSLPRHYAICPLLAMVCLMPLGQELVIGGFHFFLFRILLLIGLLRVIVKGEAKQLVWNRTDKLFAWWVAVSIVFGTLSKPSMELLRNRLGDAYNAFGAYFFIRCVIVDFEDIVTSVRTLAWLSLLVAAFMLNEKRTAHNWFSILGGVPELTQVREGHLRCQGPFRHPILAGTFGATQFPLFAALWFSRPKDRLTAIAGALACVGIVFASSSSGALMAFGAGLAGLLFWRWRDHMRLVRRGTVAAILLLALVMKAPVWHLLDRMSSITGGTGWHRAYLIDQAIAHFDEWWLFGTTYTAHWAPGGEVTTADPNMMDITNHYIAQGVGGGLLKLVLFIMIIVVSFKSVGRYVQAQAAVSPAALLVWAMGVSLFAHSVSFISATYFDQTVLIYYWLLAIIGCIGCTIGVNAWQAESQKEPAVVPA